MRAVLSLVLLLPPALARAGDGGPVDAALIDGDKPKDDASARPPDGAAPDGPPRPPDRCRLGLGDPVVVRAPEPQARAGFGVTLASGDIDRDGWEDLLVGEWRRDGASAPRAGRVYLLRGTANGVAGVPSWTAMPEPQMDGEIGVAIAVGDVDGDGLPDVVVGADGAGSSPLPAGRVYAFRGSSAGLPASPSWVLSADGGPGEGFGGALAVGDLDGDGFAEIIVGASLASVGGIRGAGRVLVFAGQRDGPAAIPVEISAPVPQQDAGFGGSLVVLRRGAAAMLAVGAPGTPETGATSVGWVYAYAEPAASPQVLRSPAPTMGASFGFTLASADLDGDGHTDLVVGADRGGDGASGMVAVFRGTADGLEETARWRASGEGPGASFGTALAAADLDRDGHVDLLVGAPDAEVQGTRTGAVYVFAGAAGGVAAAPALRLVSPISGGSYFGGALTVLALPGRRSLVAIGADEGATAGTGAIVALSSCLEPTQPDGGVPDAAPDAPVDAPSGVDAAADGASAPPRRGDDGCGCHTAGGSAPRLRWALVSLGLLIARRLRRRP